MRSFDPIWFAPQPKLGGGWIAFKDSPSPPPAPDYQGAAAAQGAANIAAARLQGRMNNPNIYTPYGSQTVTWGGGGASTNGGRLDSGFNPNISAPTPGQGGAGPLANFQAQDTSKMTPDQLRDYNYRRDVALNGGTANGPMGQMGPANGGGGFPSAPAPAWGSPESIQALQSQGLETRFNPSAGSSQWYDSASGGFMSDDEAAQRYSSMGGGGGGGGGGDPDQATIVQRLSPTQQRLFDTYQNINQQLGGVAEKGVGYVQDTLNKPFDFNALPKAPVNPGQSYTEAAFARLQPQIDQSQKALDTQLANQGITQGSEAWQNAQRQQQMGVNDQRAAITTSSMGQDRAERQAAIQEQEFGRTEPLNILNAVRSAAPVNVPQFQGYQGSTVAPAPVMQGVQAQGQAGMNAYNAQVAGNNAATSGLFGLGGAALGAAAYNPALFGLSDRRLKSNIRRIGTRSGFALYEYDIAGIHTTGVMADEVMRSMPEAVHILPSGYMAVDYGRI